MYYGDTSIQTLVITDNTGTRTKAQAISLPASAKSLTLFASGAQVFMALTEQGLDITRQRFLLPDAAASPGLTPVVIPAPQSSNNQVWFVGNAMGAGPDATLSVVVNCG